MNLKCWICDHCAAEMVLKYLIKPHAAVNCDQWAVTTCDWCGTRNEACYYRPDIREEPRNEP